MHLCTWISTQDNVVEWLCVVLFQSGAWGCFDEFNRINIEVLSVVAQQILSILQALGNQAQRFIFEGREIRLNKTCGIFITMNPGEVPCIAIARWEHLTI